MAFGPAHWEKAEKYDLKGGIFISEILEACMVISFGISWPLSILKSWRSRTTKGKSLLFLCFILFGYACGLLSKISSGKITYVFAFYILNLLMVSVDVGLYFRNRRLQTQEIVGARPAPAAGSGAADDRYQAIQANTVPADNQLAAAGPIMYDRIGPGTRVLFVGNSITRHRPKPDIGWANDWGMAASSQDKDYVHLLIKKIRARDPGAEFCIAQLAGWERQYWQGRAILDDYQEAAAFDPDIIILRLAENVARDNFAEHPFAPCYAELLDFLNPARRAQVIVTTAFWPAADVDDAIRLVARQRGYPIVELGELGLQENMMAVGLFEHAGVAAHPGDAGMAAIADAIWNQLDLRQP